ncbi:uncharacterized protein [Ptychodera flava]|uniref:uncharacterized protein n=1 Tax=Ptychodera flava TaxID=63121 RepID=UPI00396A11B1
MVDVLNTFFVSVFTNEDTSHMPESIIMFNGEDQDRLVKINVTEDDVAKKLSQLHPSKAPGPDKVSPRILITVAQQITKPLTLLFNHSLSTGEVPNDWRRANVTPVFKKGKSLMLATTDLSA